MKELVCVWCQGKRCIDIGEGQKVEGDVVVRTIKLTTPSTQECPDSPANVLEWFNLEGKVDTLNLGS